MGQLTSNTEVFKGVDKEFERLKKMLLDLQAAAKLDMGDSKNLGNYEKILDKVNLSAEKIGISLKAIASNSDIFDFPGVEEAQKHLDGLEKKVKDLEANLKDAKKSFTDTLKGSGVKTNIAQQITRDAKNSQDVVKGLEKEVLRLQERLEAKKAAGKNMGAFERSLGTDDKNGTASLAKDRGTVITSGKYTEANKIANQALREGIIQGKKFEEIWQNIEQSFKDAGIEFEDLDIVQEKLEKKFEANEAHFTGMKSAAKDIAEEMSQLGSVDEDGKVTLNQETLKIILDSYNQISEAQGKIEENNNAIAQTQAAVNSLQQDGSNTIRGIGQSADNAVDDVNDLINTQREETEEIKRTNEVAAQMQGVFDNISNTVKNALSIGNAWAQVRTIVQNTFEDVKRLDKAFASIAMVTDQTVGGLWDTYDQYAQIAKDLGQSTEDTIKASALFYQQGLDTAEALELTKDTMKLATLAGADFELATEQMTAALRGFHMEMDQGSHITDVYSELAANAAADVNGIAYAMSKTASIANSAGMDFETTSAFLTQMIETTQEAPEIKLIA